MRTAAYARYSTEMQSAASIDDQLRNVRGFCARMGWPDPEVFSDAAMSGARNDRPNYRRMLSEAHRFEVILVDDLSRFSRDSVESQQAIRRLTFAGVRVIGVSDGLDTGRKGHKADVGLRGLMGELYLDDLREKTHRGLTGKALAGSSAGGLPYGYVVTSTGQRAIREDQAAVVRRIFDEHVAGRTSREIAAGLNRDRIPSPRGSTWVFTAIRADLRRGIGILGNPIYVGQQVWNRSRWVKHPETGRRVRQERPEGEWIVTEHPELAIIDEATWEAANARTRGASFPQRGVPVRGRPPRHLLSGILRCGECGGPMVVVDRYRYGCATAKDRGTCSSRLRFAREAAEAALLAGVQRDVLGEEGFQRFQKAAVAAMKRLAPDTDTAKRKLAAAELVHANVMAAIRAGIITASTKAELVTAEREVEAARAAVKAMQRLQPAQILPRAREVWQRTVAAMADHVRDVPAARKALCTLIGDRIPVHEKAGVPYAEIAGSSRSLTMVAGAGSVLYLTEPVSIPLTTAPE